MSTTIRDRTSIRKGSRVFAALGDATRLELVWRLSVGTPLSIARLAGGFSLSRQAITKHLRVLEQAGLVRAVRRGRENLFELKPRPLSEAGRSLDRLSHQWEVALGNLKAFVER